MLRGAGQGRLGQVGRLAVQLRGRDQRTGDHLQPLQLHLQPEGSELRCGHCVLCVAGCDAPGKVHAGGSRDRQDRVPRRPGDPPVLHALGYGRLRPEDALVPLPDVQRLRERLHARRRLLRGDPEVGRPAGGEGRRVARLAGWPERQVGHDDGAQRHRPGGGHHQDLEGGEDQRDRVLHVELPRHGHLPGRPDRGGRRAARPDQGGAPVSPSRPHEQDDDGPPGGWRGHDDHHRRGPPGEGRVLDCCLPLQAAQPEPGAVVVRHGDHQRVHPV
mmetsp:Transcript_63507/g.186348  ORF Transcript_63507/g.186348 Transcript_63507/m.186348 type:complete len:273 (-) Transcript_63507:752-1570(-)